MWNLMAGVVAAESTIDTTLVNELIALVKSVLGLFTVYPLNLFLIAGLVFIALAIFTAAKKAAKR